LMSLLLLGNTWKFCRLRCREGIGRVEKIQYLTSSVVHTIKFNDHAKCISFEFLFIKKLLQ